MTVVIARSRRGLLSTLAALVVLAVGATAALAFWSTHGAGSATASTGSLGAPTGVTAAATGTNVLVSWAQASPPAGSSAASVSYQVFRSGTVAAVCSTSGLTNTSCTDSGVPSGTYNYTVKALMGSWTATSTASSNVTVVAASKLAVISSALSGSASSSATLGPVTVQIQDANGNPAPGTATTMNLSSSSTGAVFALTTGGASITSLTVPSGQSSASFYYGDTKAGTPTITAAATGLTSATQLENVTAAAANTVSVNSGSGQSAVIGGNYSTLLAATVTDQFGNPVSGTSVTFAAPGSGASGTFANTTTTTSATTTSAGVATATAIKANNVAGTFTVTATVSGHTPASFSMTNLAGPAAVVATVSGDNQQTTVGQPYSTALVVSVKDASGNPVSGASVTFAAPASGASGTFANGTASTTATSDATGQATSSIFTANTTAGGVAVSATSGSATSAGFSLINKPAAASKLIFSTAPSGNQTATATASMGPYQVQEQDSFGNSVPAGSGVTVSLSTSATTGSHFFSTTQNGVAGTAITSVAITSGNSTSGSFYYADNKAGAPTLTASASGIASNATTPPTIVAAVANRAVFTNCSVTGAGATAACSASGGSSNVSLPSKQGQTPAGTFTASVTLIDQFGNVATNSTGGALTVTVAFAGASASDKGHFTAGSSAQTVNTPLSVANGSSQSGTTFTFTPDGNADNPYGTISTAGAGLTAVNATLRVT
jgi:hypothetical protein